MKLPFIQILRSFRSSYWFLPSLMLIGAIGLGALTVWLDASPAAGLFDGISWYQKSKPNGAREVLSTIAGSMITVAGVVFSITIVAISFAAGQYGPRILSNFMSDRGNQVTLGTFIATFAYAVVVLRTIHGGESNFVPQLAVMTSLALALCSIAVLIYFIHHVPQSIHINSITARIGRELLAAIETEFPSCFGDPPDMSEQDRERLNNKAAELFGVEANVACVPADDDGYLQALDTASLIKVACKHGVAIRVEQAPGQFVVKGQPILRAAPASAIDTRLCREMQRSWTIGAKRTADEDPLFLVDELVEIGARAMSTGVNDPHTASTCVDWLASGAAKMAGRQAPSPYRVDDAGELRAVVPPPDFRLHIERSFGQLRPYLARDINATVHAFAALRTVAGFCTTNEQRSILLEELKDLSEQAERSLQGPSRERVIESALSTLLALSAPAS